MLFFQSILRGSRKLTLLAISLLDKMLQLDPQRRCSAAEALTSQYLAPYHDSADEPSAAEMFDWSFLEADLPADVWKTVMYAEVLGYHGKASGSIDDSHHLDVMDSD